MYQAMIARRLKLSKTAVSRFCQFLEDNKLIQKNYKDPLQRRATTYRTDIRLARADYKDKSDFTLVLPHKLRFGAPIVKKSKPISTTTGRFSHAQVKFIKSWKPKGEKKLLFEMNHPSVGKIGIIAHRNSIEVFQRNRHHILAKDLNESNFILSMGLREAAARFVQEQGWNEVDVDIGDFHMIGSPHYAVATRDGKQLIKDGKTHISLLGGNATIDDSPKHFGRPDEAELEFERFDAADEFDQKLRKVEKIDRELPELIALEVTKSLTEREQQASQISGELVTLRNSINRFDEVIQRIDTNCNNVAATVQSGTPLQNQFQQITTIVARQGESIHLIQQSLISMIEQMGKVMERVDNRANDSDRQRLAMAEEIMRLQKENEDLKQRLGSSPI